MEGSLIAFIYPLVFHKVVLWGRYCSQCMLKLNSWLLGRHQPGRVSIGELSVGDSEVVPVITAKKLGAWMDSHLKLDTHITKTWSAAYHHLHNIQRIWKYITYKSTQNLVHAVVVGRIDCLYHEFGFSEEIPIPFEVPWWVVVNSTFLQVKDTRRQNLFHGHTHIIE